jgi:hypothetical protein
VTGIERRIGQRAIRNNFALRDQNDPRDGKDKHQRERQQRVDRAIDHAILQQDQNDQAVHRQPDPNRDWCDRRLAPGL